MTICQLHFSKKCNLSHIPILQYNHEESDKIVEDRDRIFQGKFLRIIESEKIKSLEYLYPILKIGFLEPIKLQKRKTKVLQHIMFKNH